MSKVILLTGATDGIGLATAEKLVAAGHHLLIHGRSESKLKSVEENLKALNKGSVESFCADLSDFADIERLRATITKKFSHIDVLINNAGIYKTDKPLTKNNLDIRFVVNTVAPYMLTKGLLPIMSQSGRIINLSSAAQAPVDLDALVGKKHIEEQFNVYAQSKLALVMWSRHLAAQPSENMPDIISINPGSLLASKMVKEGFGIEGNDLNIGADILVKASSSRDFSNVSGQYFDNDSGRFSDPHVFALDKNNCELLVNRIEDLIKQIQTN